MNDSSQWVPLPVLQTVLTGLEQNNISFCHWKSNYHLEYALTGKEDVDVLIALEDFPRFVQVLLEQDFKQADSITSRMQPGVYHFLGNDGETGTLVNIHAYTRIMTGDHFMKSWTLPLEQLLLADTSQVNGMRVPSRSSELIVFVFRNMIKHTTLIDIFFAMRSTQATAEEYQWLMSGADVNDSLARLGKYFPGIPATDFRNALDLLAGNSTLSSKIRLGRRFKRNLNKYRRYGPVKQTLLTAIAIGRMAVNRLGRKEKHMAMHTGGKIIALVGPQATGKSTLTMAIKKWLGQELSVRTIHAGKPPSTWLTFLPNRIVPLGRALLPGYRTVTIEKEAEDEDYTDFPLVFIIRKVMLAYDRRKLLRCVYRESRNGKMIISDRYPSDVIGAIDGATFRDEAISRESSALKRTLMRWERKLYQEVCPPDMILQLTVSAEMAVLRNKTRDKQEGQTTEYVLARHTMRYTPEFHHCPVIELSTDRDFDGMLIEVKQEIWKRL